MQKRVQIDFLFRNSYKNGKMKMNIYKKDKNAKKAEHFFQICKKHMQKKVENNISKKMQKNMQKRCKKRCKKSRGCNLKK